ncbi:MAG TPA: hypothetical protein VGR45_08715, partial [Stellaceae bacterium]|nr:hypothetical protein [Stellaceae bacterium]
MERQYSVRRERERRQRFISSPTFDPAEAMAALKSWTTRTQTIIRFRSSLSAIDPYVFSAASNAVQRGDVNVEIFDKTGHAR